jgi:hypothetical protein
MPQAATAVIGGEDDLWGLLEQFVQDTGPSLETLKISGWKPELLYFPDEPRGHLVYPSNARSILEFHANLSRAYAYLLYGKPNARLLRPEDKRDIDIKILVVDGSNGFKVLEDAIDTLIKRLVDKMTGPQVVFSIVVFLLLFFGADVARDWINQKYEAQKHSEETSTRLELSKEETRRMQVMADAMRKKPDLQPLVAPAEEAKEALVKGVVNTPNARVLGVEITGEQAQVILSSPRQKGAGRRLDGIYDVLKIDREYAQGWIGTIKNTATNEEFSVEINHDDLTEQDRRIIFDSVEHKLAISLQVNAWVVGDRISRAVVIRAESLK